MTTETNPNSDEANSGNLIFLSHACDDEEIARYIKDLLQRALRNIDVFMTSDPEDLQPGELWPKLVLQNLGAAKVVLLLATERGLLRRWVWFEAGAAWRMGLPLIACCLGKLRPGRFPQPFSNFQVIELDNPKGLEELLTGLAKRFAVTPESPDTAEVTENLIRLDVRAEERHGGNYSLEQQWRKQAQDRFHMLGKIEQEALRELLIRGELTERQLETIIVRQGNPVSGRSQLFAEISRRTGFLFRNYPPEPSESTFGYTGPWRINPTYKQLLEELMSAG